MANLMIAAIKTILKQFDGISSFIIIPRFDFKDYCSGNVQATVKPSVSSALFQDRNAPYGSIFIDDVL